ncbi:MAG: hypothetical protein MRJ65_15410 [Candidatus Brocadiaceae bacterium]|nr:hypothetical protein [Candidatus Brocadiaceae bacterium]
MATQRQILANRKNALRSTGPKNTSITRFNGLKYGLRANSEIIPDEDPEQLQALKDGVKVDLSPDGELEGEIAKQIAGQLWLLRRAQAAESAIIVREARFSGPGEYYDWQALLGDGYLLQASRLGNRAMRRIDRLLKGLRDMREGVMPEKR